MIGARDSEELRARLLNEAGVAVLADIHFGPRVPNEGQHIRFSYAASNEAIQKGVERMADFIRRNTLRAKASRRVSGATSLELDSAAEGAASMASQSLGGREVSVGLRSCRMSSMRVWIAALICGCVRM